MHFLFLIIDLYFLILFNTAELVIPTGTPTNEANAEIETAIDTRNKNKEIFKVIESPAHNFMLFNH